MREGRKEIRRKSWEQRGGGGGGGGGGKNKKKMNEVEMKYMKCSELRVIPKDK